MPPLFVVGRVTVPPLFVVGRVTVGRVIIPLLSATLPVGIVGRVLVTLLPLPLLFLPIPLKPLIVLTPVARVTEVLAALPPPKPAVPPGRFEP